MNRLIPFLCVFMYYASPYRLGGHVIPEFICLLAVLLIVIKKQKAYLPKEYVFFMIYIWFVPPLLSVIIGLPGNHWGAFFPLGLILMSLNIAFIIPNVDSSLVIKYYKYLVYIAVGFFFFQEIAVATIGYRPTAYLSFLDSYYTDMDMDSFAQLRSETSRSSSFFLEPSHFIQYIFPYICILITDDFKKKKISKELLLMILVVLLARTGVGFMLFAVVTTYLYLVSSDTNMFKRIMFVLLAFAVYFTITHYLSNNLFVSEVLQRSSEFSLEVEQSGSQSGFLRIWRGYFIYGAMDWINQLFGASIGSFEYLSSRVNIPGVRYDGVFFNGIQSLLVGGGIVGLILFFNYIIKIFKNINQYGRCILIALIGLCFVENMLYTPKMFLYILLACCINKVIILPKI